MTSGPLLAVAAVATGFGILAARAPRAWLLSTLLAVVAAGAAAVAVLAGGPDWDWRPGFAFGGEPVRLLLDGVAALFLALVCVVGGAGAVYASTYWADAEHPRSARVGRAWWSGLLLCLGLVLTAANGLHFLIAWELFAICAYGLITLDRRRAEVRAAGWLYLAASHAGTLCLFALFATLAARTGSWALGPMRERADLAPLFWLALVGFGLKAGVFPLHVWLPSAHASAPSHVSAVLSGVTIKVSVYGLVRWSGWFPVPPAAPWAVTALGGASAVLGVAFALGQHDLKRLLAYHSVENVGIILLGLGFALLAAQRGDATWGRLALAGGLLHVWNHGLFKALLFLGAGSVAHAAGTREMSRLGGLWRSMPWTTACFALGAAAIVGLPPLNGFVSEWLVYLGLFDAAVSRGGAAWIAVASAVLLAVTGALALACFVKACGVVFLGAPRSEGAARAHECARPMRAAMLVLAFACVAIGLAPVVVWPALAAAAGAWRPAWAGAPTPGPLAALCAAHVAIAAAAVAAGAWLARRSRREGLTRAPTWDCGYAAPTPRMQYTAGSFGATLVSWFAGVLRPERHGEDPDGPFPRSASRSEHVPETVLERLVRPVAVAVLAVSGAARRLQHGRVQSYVLYLLIGVAALAAIAWGGGE